jgi:hypothetical protein
MSLPKSSIPLVTPRSCRKSIVPLAVTDSPKDDENDQPDSGFAK